MCNAQGMEVICGLRDDSFILCMESLQMSKTEPVRPVLWVDLTPGNEALITFVCVCVCLRRRLPSAIALM